MELIEGTKTEAKIVVRENDLATVLQMDSKDSFPKVFATAKMIALMEVAAARMFHPHLQKGDLSVGVGVNVKHIAATPIGKIVCAEATFVGMEGKLYKFTVEAFDEAGKIGFGEHTRAVVNNERLIEGANKRVC